MCVCAVAREILCVMLFEMIGAYADVFFLEILQFPWFRILQIFMVVIILSKQKINTVWKNVLRKI